MHIAAHPLASPDATPAETGDAAPEQATVIPFTPRPQPEPRKLSLLDVLGLQLFNNDDP